MKFILQKESGGIFLEKNENPTKTILCMMVKFVKRTYSDIVCKVPVVSVNSQLIKESFMKTLAAVSSIGSSVVCVLVDGHKANRKFYKEELCNGKSKNLHFKSKGSKGKDFSSV